MAAQFDVNLEKFALFKCVCVESGSRIARSLQNRCLCAHLLLKSPTFFGHTDKISLKHLSNLLKLYIYLCALRITPNVAQKANRMRFRSHELERETSKNISIESEMSTFKSKKKNQIENVC